MASSSGLKQGSVPMDNIGITPEATYEEVIADPKLFMSSLERLHSFLGTKFMVPIIGGRLVDLHKLFVEVTSRGGIKKILDDRRWKEVTASFAFPAAATNATSTLRKYYFSLLNNYEQVYFFKSFGQIPPDSLQIPSATPGVMQGTIRHSQELQVFTPQPNIESGEFPEGSLIGSNVSGVIDGKCEEGYLVTVTIGAEQLKGALYHLPPQNTVVHQAPQQSQSSGDNNAGGVTKRRRRRKNEMNKKRDPAHPKPNRSGYTFFFAEQHARLKPLHPGDEFVKISRMIGNLWKNLNEEEKTVYKGQAMEDKERYLFEMEIYKHKLRTGQLTSNTAPLLQLTLPEQNVDMAEADLPMEEEEEEEDNASGCSGETELVDDQNGESDPEIEEAPLSLSGINLNLYPNEM